MKQVEITTRVNLNMDIDEYEIFKFVKQVKI